MRRIHVLEDVQWLHKNVGSDSILILFFLHVMAVSAHHQALSAQTSGGVQPSNLMGPFQPMGTWVNPALRDARRADINIT